MKRLILGLGIILFAINIAGIARSAPTNLQGFTNAGPSIDLVWTGQSDEQYNVFKSTDGTVWEKIYGPTEPGTSTLTLTEGIQNWINYYFVVTDASVESYAYGISPELVTNEIVVYPPDQHAHSFYAGNTEVCAECHRTHTAQGPKLMAMATLVDTCITCHDGSASKYNVVDGTVLGPDGMLLNSSGGMFGRKVFGMALDETKPEPESIHSIGAVANTAPGGDPFGSTAAWKEPLGCGSCHDAHGSVNFRMLKTKTPMNNNVRVRAYSKTDVAAGKEVTVYIDGINSLCEGCHPDFNAIHSGSGATGADNTASPMMEGKFRHTIGVAPSSYEKRPLSTTLPLEGSSPNYNDNKIMCLTCHHVHGSTVTNDAPLLSNWNEFDFDGLTDNRNFMLRMDNMGVCQDCHNM